MTAQTEPEIVLYDLACIKNICYLPAVWRIRFMLNCKKVPYRSIFLEFSDIEPTLKGLWVTLSAFIHLLFVLHLQPPSPPFLLFISQYTASINLKSPPYIQRPSPCPIRFGIQEQIHSPRHSTLADKHIYDRLAPHRSLPRVNLPGPTSTTAIGLRPQLGDRGWSPCRFR